MLATILKWFRCERANVAPLIAIMAIPIVAAFGIAAETGSWWTLQRAQQNAADSAVIAAAIKGATSEGATVATNYGYTNNVGNATLTWPSPSSTLCPATVTNLVPGTSCYQVTITKKVPLYLTQVVGFREGSTVIGTAPAKTITASAIAGTIASTSAYCIGANDQIVMNGGGSSGPNAFQGCSLIAGGSLTCSGTNAAGGVLYGAAPVNGNNGGQNTCGTPTTDSTYADPYATRIGNGISGLTSCSSTQTGGGTIDTTKFVQGGVNCLTGGDWTLAGAWAATGDNTIIKVSGGNLTLGAKLSTSGSGTMTVAFTGQTTNSTGVLAFANGGTLDILSPTNGAWNDNVVIAVDPALQGGSVNGSGTFSPCTAAINKTCPQDITAGGNTTMDLTGLIYDPNGTITLAGAINKASIGSDICILMWAKNIVGNGGEAYGVPAPGKDCYKRDSSVPTINIVALLQ